MAFFLSCVLLAERVRAVAQFDVQLTLDVSIKVSLTRRTPVVHSYASASLVDENGGRIYGKQVILDHRIRDLTTGFDRFASRVVTDIGYASNTSGDLLGDYGDCYDAQMNAVSYQADATRDLSTFAKCMPALYLPKPDVPRENCPVLLDLAQDGFHLSGPDPAVRFDIDADGVPDNIAWTRSGGDDAFLCMDRNHNGIIENGRELFGYATPLLSGKPAKIGYRALADLDALVAGGNSDGIIDFRDTLFHELCAWVDQNRDGVSQPAEIFSLDQVGVSYLEYDYRQIKLWDSYGNLFRYVSRVGMRTPQGSVTPWPTFDVIFGEP